MVVPGEGPKVMLKVENLLIEVMQCIRNYPKTERYTLGERTELTLLSAAENIFYASYNQDARTQRLKTARTQFQMATWLLRLARRQSFISDGFYEKMSTDLIEIGKMISGWIKTSEKVSAKRN